MANPLVPQGNINRLVASINFTTAPSFNITPSFLAKEAIRLSFAGNATTVLPTSTGVVNSPEPYMMAHFTAHLIRSQALAASFKQLMETSTLMGDCTIRPDATTLPPYSLSNCSIESVDPMTFAGGEAGWVINFNGVYYINQALWQ